MNKDLENFENKPQPRRSGKRLLYFLLVPAVLVTSAFIGVKARQKTSQQLKATTQTLEVQTVTA